MRFIRHASSGCAPTDLRNRPGRPARAGRRGARVRPRGARGRRLFLEVGLIGEPVYVGEKSGLEFFVNKGDTPVEGLEKTLKAEVIVGEAKRDLPIKARFDEKGAYESVFIPTASGKYTFHIYGTVEGDAVDESFTSSPDGFNEVQEATSGQFPVTLPTAAELSAEAKKGADAASQATIAVALGAAGLIAGLLALGVALAGRRRSMA